MQPLDSAVMKLRHGAGSCWSASVSPEECQALLDALAKPAIIADGPIYHIRDVVKVVPTPSRFIPPYLTGDPGDETNAG